MCINPLPLFMEDTYILNYLPSYWNKLLFYIHNYLLQCSSGTHPCLDSRHGSPPSPPLHGSLNINPRGGREGQGAGERRGNKREKAGTVGGGWN